MKTMPFVITVISMTVVLFCHSLGSVHAQSKKKGVKVIPKEKEVLSDVTIQEYIDELKALNDKNRKNRIPENILAGIVKEVKAMKEFPPGETDALRFARSVILVCQKKAGQVLLPRNAMNSK